MQGVIGSILRREVPNVRDMNVQTVPPSPEQQEAAIRTTLLGWCDELYDGQKFWWGDWTRIIEDVITAMRTGTPVDYGDD